MADDNYCLLRNIGCSYVLDTNGEPLVVYYSTDTELFTSKPIANQKTPCFLKILKPVIIDVLDKNSIEIPDNLPDGCDGIIFTNYGSHRIFAYHVFDLSSQVMWLKQVRDNSMESNQRKIEQINPFCLSLISVVNSLLDPKDKPLRYEMCYYESLARIQKEMMNSKRNYMGHYRVHNSGPSITVQAFLLSIVADLKDYSVFRNLSLLSCYRIMYFLSVAPDVSFKEDTFIAFESYIADTFKVVEGDIGKRPIVPCLVNICFSKDEKDIKCYFPVYEYALDYINSYRYVENDPDFERAVIWIWGEHGWNFIFGKKDDPALGMLF